MEKNREFKLNKWQDKFVFSNDRYTALFNEFGSGKTSAGIIKAHNLLQDYPNNFGIAIRNFREDLRTGTIPQYFNLIFGNRNLVPENVYWNSTNSLLRLENGSELKFMALDRPEDVGKLKNIVIGFFFIDQAEEIAEEVFTMLDGRLRLPGMKHQGFITGNPEGGDHWIRTKFYNKHLDVNKTEIDGVKTEYGYYQGLNENYYGIVAKPLGNAANLPGGYYERLKQSFPRDWQLKYIYSLWTGKSGLVYPFTDDSIIYENEQEFQLNSVPEYSRICYAQDYGISDTSPMVWLTLVKYNECYYLINEYYEYEKGIDHVCDYAKNINSIIWIKPEFTVGCPRTFQREGTSRGKTPADLFRKQGLNITKFPVPFETRHPILAKLIETGNFKIYSDCENAIKEFKSYKWRNIKSANNHAIEAVERAIARFVTVNRSKEPELDSKKQKALRPMTAGMMGSDF